MYLNSITKFCSLIKWYAHNAQWHSHFIQLIGITSHHNGNWHSFRVTNQCQNWWQIYIYIHGHLLVSACISYNWFINDYRVIIHPALLTPQNAWYTLFISPTGFSHYHSHFPSLRIHITSQLHKSLLNRQSRVG